MTQFSFVRLEDRGVIAVRGDDTVTFLQGIVSNDVAKVSNQRASYGAFLTPQGKYLFDFFMVRIGEDLLIETERARIPDFIKRLGLYKLRAKVQLSDMSEDFAVYAVFGDDAGEGFGLDGACGSAVTLDGGSAFVDPRLAMAGARLIVPAPSAGAAFANMKSATATDYDRHRLALGLPDGSRDLVVDKSVLMESGFDELNGIDWQKGCYMGQEVTARTKHRGLVKKRLLPVSIDGTAPESGAPVMADGRVVGEMRSANDEFGLGLALIRLDALDGDAPMTAGDAVITPQRPDWARF